MSLCSSPIFFPLLVVFSVDSESSGQATDVELFSLPCWYLKYQPSTLYSIKIFDIEPGALQQTSPRFFVFRVATFDSVRYFPFSKPKQNPPIPPLSREHLAFLLDTDCSDIPPLRFPLPWRIMISAFCFPLGFRVASASSILAGWDSCVGFVTVSISSLGYCELGITTQAVRLAASEDDVGSRLFGIYSIHAETSNAPSKQAVSAGFMCFAGTSCVAPTKAPGPLLAFLRDSNVCVCVYVCGSRV